MELKKKTVAGVGANTLRSILEAAISLSAFLVFVRWLDPADFGVYAIATAFISLTKAGQDLGFSRAIIQMESLKRNDRDTAFWTLSLLGILLTLLFLGIAGPIAVFFDEPQLRWVLPVLALGVLLHGFSDVARATLSRHLSFVYLGTVTVIGTVVGAVLGITLAYHGAGVWSLVAYQLGITATGAIAFWLGAGWAPGLRWSNQSFLRQFRFGIYVIGKKFVQRTGERTDDLLIGYFMGSTLLGYYAVAYRVLKIARQLLVQTLINVAIPAFSRLQTRLERLKQALMEAIELTALIAVPCFVGLGWLAPELIRFLFGPRWSPAIPILQVLIFAGIADVILRFHTPVLIALDHTDKDFFVTLVHSLLLIGLFIPAVHYNLTIVASAYALASLLTIPVAYGAVRQDLLVGGRDYMTHLTPTLYSTGGALVGLIGISAVSEGWTDPITILGATTAAVTGGLIISFLFDRERLYKLADLIKSGTGQSITQTSEGPE